MGFEPFLLERWQSIHEHGVEINLSDSGVHPMSVAELLGDDAAGLAGQRLIYTQTNGTPELRQRIAALHEGATAAEVVVVNGGAEANFLSTWTLLEPGDEVVVQVPNYMQIAGIARTLDHEVKLWQMQADLDGDAWKLDLAELESLVGPRTKLIAICNPNNPTGWCLADEMLDGIAAVARRNESWVLSDEIYQGSEYSGQPTPSMWGRDERVIVTNSLSKSYGLPGLRLGWALCPAPLAADIWARHDYTTIAPGALSDWMACKALDKRDLILERTRGLLSENYSRVAAWLDDNSETLRHVRPQAGAMLFLHYDLAINSSELAERLRSEASVLLVPGDHYGMDHWLRIGFGGETEEVVRGLERLDALLRKLR